MQVVTQAWVDDRISTMASYFPFQNKVVVAFLLFFLMFKLICHHHSFLNSMQVEQMCLTTIKYVWFDYFDNCDQTTRW